VQVQPNKKAAQYNTGVNCSIKRLNCKKREVKKKKKKKIENEIKRLNKGKKKKGRRIACKDVVYNQVMILILVLRIVYTRHPNNHFYYDVVKLKYPYSRVYLPFFFSLSLSLSLSFYSSPYSSCFLNGAMMKSAATLLTIL
jgi:hypothetical protein